MVQVHLVGIAGLDVASLAVDGREEHVEQIGRAVDVERARGDAVLRKVAVLLVGVACARHDEEHALASDGLLDARDEAAQRVVELQIDALHFGLPICRSAVGVGCRERHREHVAHFVGAHCASLHHFERHVHHLVVRQLLVFRDFPRDARIELEPLGLRGGVVGRGAPACLFRVDPEHAVGSVSGRQNGRFLARRHAPDDGRAVCAHFQFVAHGRGHQTMGRGEVRRVIDAENGPQRAAVEPSLADDAVVVGRGARGHGADRRGIIDGRKRIGSHVIDPAVFHQFAESRGVVERRESL